jgi:hypothetical protein
VSASRESDLLRQLQDRHAIADLHHRLAACLDASRFDELTEVLTEDVVVEGWSDEPWHGRRLAAEQLAAINAEHLGSHRMLTNERLTLDGDEVRAVWHYRATHLEREAATTGYGSTHSHEGWYLTRSVRRAAGWRIIALRHVSLADTDPRKDSGRRIAGEVYRGA